MVVVPETPSLPHEISKRSSWWSKSRYSGSDDDLYLLTDDESVKIPLFASNSVKERAARAKSRYPSILIPRFEEWPLPPSLTEKIAVGHSRFSGANAFPSSAQLGDSTTEHMAHCASRTSTPSLDDALTMGDVTISSCPSTPEMSADWDPPAKLSPEIIDVLKTIVPGGLSRSPSYDNLHIQDDAATEMRRFERELEVNRLAVSDGALESEPVSALTVPSPATFFASLPDLSRQPWCLGRTPPPISTSTAERFYGVPWRTETPLQNKSPACLNGLTLDTNVDPLDTGRPTALRVESLFSPVQEVEAIEMDSRLIEIQPRVERTRKWLYSQYVWVNNFKADQVPAENLKSCFSPDTPSSGTASLSSFSPNAPSTALLAFTPTKQHSPSKKSVTFLETVAELDGPEINQSFAGDRLFFEGIRSVQSRRVRREAFTYCQIRAEADHLASSHMGSQRISQLRGHYSIDMSKHPAAHRPISALVTNQTEDEESKRLIDLVGHEQQVLEQVLPTLWELNANQSLFGSALIAKLAVRHLRSKPNTRILDYGGIPMCDWSWSTALTFPSSSIVTLTFDHLSANHNLPGPENHIVVSATSPLALPFPDNHFDLISARTLYSTLRTISPSPDKTSGKDEFDFVISEFHRVLKPGGYLEFNLMDAELLQPGPLAFTLGQEFASMLHHRQYDPQATRHWLPRLCKGQFSEVKRTWIALPCADLRRGWTDQGRMRTNYSTTPNLKKTAHALMDSCTDTAALSDDLPPSDRRARHFKVQKGNGFDGLPEYFEPSVTGTTGNVRAMSGLVGARVWERWIMKLQREMGGDEELMLARVNRALEEAGSCGAAWKCLVGWARK